MHIQTELRAALHNGPFEQPLWSSFLDQLKTATAADYAGLSFRPQHALSNAPVELYAGHNEPSSTRRSRADARVLDPLRELMTENRVYALSELLDTSKPDHRAFFDGFMLPRGMVYMRAIRVAEGGGVNAWLSVARAKSDFPATCATLLKSLTADLEWSLRSYLAIDQARFKATVTSDALQRLNFGWIGLDASCLIVETSPHAEAIMQHSDEISRDNLGRLTLAKPPIHAELRHIVSSFSLNAQQARPRTLHIGSDPWTDILLLPVKDSSISAASRPAAIAFIQGDQRSAADRQDRIAELFGLTPSEARLALALSRGRSITEAAADLGLAVQTVRTYSKMIYAKVGARGQTDLVRFILASVLMLT